MQKKKKARETASEQVRVYPSTHIALQDKSFETGKTIARIISELLVKE